ncbi:MAG: PAS domain-containing protein [Acidobacteriia bacterium]|nr:PAS domain-containing protein [Terriglobia bacterium]
MRLLSNPILLRMGLAFVAAAFAFVMGTLLMRRMRRSLTEEASLTEDSSSPEKFPLHTYHAVIQQLKQQKHELLSEQQMERRRAKTSENISAAVLSNLSSGVMFFTPNGLIRQANAAAKQILGFASPIGMNTAEIFRSASLLSGSGSPMSLAEAVQASLREQTPSRRLEARYVTPSGGERMLDITVTSVYAPNGDVLGAACLINDQTEIAEIRRQQELRGEMSAEMALELRNSLATISGYAQQLAANRDPELARQLAADIAAESAHLGRTIGGFLAGAGAAKAASQA